MMSSVFYKSPQNNNLFTTCCEKEIGGDEKTCRLCGVELWYTGVENRHKIASEQVHAHGYGNWNPRHRFAGHVLKSLCKRDYKEELYRRLEILEREKP